MLDEINGTSLLAGGSTGALACGQIELQVVSYELGKIRTGTADSGRFSLA